jgi:hypothetical protein
MSGVDEVGEDEKAGQRREEGYRREEAIRGLLKRHDDRRLSIGASKKLRTSWVSAGRLCID